MITTGATVICRQTADMAWVVKGPAGEGRAVHLVSKITDTRGREHYVSRTAGFGDVSVIAPPASYQPGTKLEVGGLTYEVARDLGDTVELISPDETVVTRSGLRLRWPGGNTVEISKAELAIEQI